MFHHYLLLFHNYGVANVNGETVNFFVGRSDVNGDSRRESFGRLNVNRADINANIGTGIYFSDVDKVNCAASVVICVIAKE